MRIKTLLIAAAALAVGIGSSQADQTYSANIVGYYNSTVTNNSKYTVVSVQMNCGGSNGLNEVFASFSTNQSGDIVFIWDPTLQQFKSGGYLFYWDPSLGAQWYDQGGNGNLVTNFPVIAAGKSCFVLGSGVNPSDSVTVMGSVSIPNGGSNTIPFLGNSLYTLVSSQLPESGGLYNLGLNPPDGTIAFIWSQSAQTFRAGGYAFFSQYGWYDQGGNGNVITNTGVTFTNAYGVWSDVPVNVGDGVFILGGAPGTGSTNWTQVLNVQ